MAEPVQVPATDGMSVVAGGSNACSTAYDVLETQLQSTQVPPVPGVSALGEGPAAAELRDQPGGTMNLLSGAALAQGETARSGDSPMVGIPQMADGRLTVRQAIEQWRPGSEDWSWSDEAADLYRHQREQMSILEASIAVDGLRTCGPDEEPIYLAADGRCWNGHHRLVAAWTLCPDALLPEDAIIEAVSRD